MKFLLVACSFLVLVGCESHAQVVERCFVEVAKAETRFSHATAPPQQGKEYLAVARVELDGTQPIRACGMARQAVRLLRTSETSQGIVYVPIPSDLDYSWDPAPTPSTSSKPWDGIFSEGSDSGGWSGSSSSSSSSYTPPVDTGGWSGSSGFGGSDSGGWSGSSGGSDNGGW